MSLICVDGCDGYTTIIQRWTELGGSGQTLVAARNGNGIQASNQNRGVRKIIPYQSDTIVGVAVNLASLVSTSVITFAQDGTQHAVVAITNSGTVVFGRSNGSDFNQGGVTWLGNSTSGVISAGVWYYLEAKVNIHQTTGYGVVRVNGVELINVTNQDTLNGSSGAGFPNQIDLFADGQGTALTWTIDDLYIANISGGAPRNDFLGDVKVETLLPNGNGNSSQFVGSDGNSTDNYLLVDESPPNDDTDYVQSPTPGNKDTYAFGNLATTSGTVLGVQTVPRIRKTDAGSRTFVTVARETGGPTEADSAAVSATDTYISHQIVHAQKPGATEWTIADVNAAEFGVKVNS